MTTSAKVIEANRENAKLSTGPKTEEGKATVAKNSVRHGLSSRFMVLSDESKKDFEAMRDDLFASLMPEGPLESLLVDRIAQSAWRLQRVVRLETESFGDGRKEKEDDVSRLLTMRVTRGLEPVTAASVFSRLERDGDAITRLCRYEASIERSLYRAIHELQRLQVMRCGGNAPAPVAIDVQVSTAEDAVF